MGSAFEGYQNRNRLLADRFLFWGLGSLQYDEIFLPSPAETWTAIKELVSNGTLWADIAASVNRVLKGWGLAVVIAVPVGLVVGHFKPIRWIVEPILSLFRFIPAIALTSLFLMWFGVDDTSKVALILYAAFFQVLVNTIAGVVATDHSLMEAASCMGASRLRVFSPWYCLPQFRISSPVFGWDSAAVSSV